MVVLFCTTNTTFLLQSSDTPKNYGFVRWVDPPPIHPHQDYIYYQQNHIFDLEREVSSGKTDVEEDGTIMVVVRRSHHALFHVATALVTKVQENARH